MDRHVHHCPCGCHGRKLADCDPAYPEGCGHLHTRYGCPGCGHRVADNALCTACTRKLGADLELVAWLDEQLTITRTKQDRVAERDASRSSGSPLGFRPEAMDAADVLHVTLVMWARDVASTVGVPVTDVPAESPPLTAAWLLSYSETIRHFAIAGELSTEIAYAVTEAERAVDYPDDRQRFYVGPCPETLGDQAVPCDGAVWAYIPSSVRDPARLRCRGCGTAWDTIQWLRVGHRILQRAAQLAHAERSGRDPGEPVGGIVSTPCAAGDARPMGQ